MTPFKVTAWSIAVAALIPVAVAACGDNGQDLNGTQCPNIPPYTYKARTDANGNPVTTATGDQIWDIVGTDGKPLSTTQLNAVKAAIAAAEKGNCITPTGSALTLDPATGTAIPR